jgi:hypothetical protein
MYNLTTTFVHNRHFRNDLGSNKRNGMLAHNHNYHTADENAEHDGFDSYLIDVIVDLENLKRKSSSRSVIDGCVYTA